MCYLNFSDKDLVSNGETEKWVQISRVKGLEMFKDYYWISNFGRVKSFGGRSGNRIMKQATERDSYLRVELQTSDGKPKKMLVHRLVGFAFVSGYENGLVCNHLDERKENNHYLNLEWCTVAENNVHGTRMKRIAEKLSKAVIGECVKTGKIIKFESTEDAGRCGFNQGNVSSACRGEYNSHCKHGGTNIYKNYEWKYEEAEENDNG